MEVFGHNHSIPFSKMLTFYRSAPFTLTASYGTPPPSFPQTYIGMALNINFTIIFNPFLYSIIFSIGVFVIKNVKPTPEGESSKVKVKVRVNLNGLLTVASAALIEKRELTQQEKEEEEKQQQQSQQQPGMDVDQQAEKKDKSDQEAQANEPPAPEVCMFVIPFHFFTKT